MANISITVGAFTATKTVSNTDLSRLLSAYQTIYGQVPVDANAVPIVYRDMTSQETFDKFANGLFQGIVANIKRAEQTIAANTAIANVTNITLT
jgi:hypothetical protein